MTVWFSDGKPQGGTSTHMQIHDVWPRVRTKLEQIVHELADQLDADDEAEVTVATLKQLELACKVVKLLPEQPEATVRFSAHTYTDDELETIARHSER